MGRLRVTTNQKQRHVKKISIRAFAVLMVFSLTQLVYAEKNIETDDQKKMKALTEEAVGNVLGNFIAVGSGVIKSGDRIPLPVYRDGSSATRDESHYFVSPNEITTSMQGLSPSAGIYYIQCQVDKSGLVNIALKQQGSYGGKDYDVTTDPGYESLQKHYERNSISSISGSGKANRWESGIGDQAQTMTAIRDRVLANYLVLAIRSQNSK
jgi:hypothetical protein